MSEEKKSEEFDAENSSTNTILALGEAIFENLEEPNLEEMDVFEDYTEALKTKIHLRNKDFPQRLLKGYQVLCKTLDSPSESK